MVQNDCFYIPLGETGQAPKIYAIIYSTEDCGSVYRTTTDEMEPYATPNLASYVIEIGELSHSGVYAITIPDSLQIPGKSYVVLIREKANPGDPPSESDEIIHGGSIDFGAPSVDELTGRLQVVSD